MMQRRKRSNKSEINASKTVGVVELSHSEVKSFRSFVLRSERSPKAGTSHVLPAGKNLGNCKPQKDSDILRMTRDWSSQTSVRRESYVRGPTAFRTPTNSTYMRMRNLLNKLKSRMIRRYLFGLKFLCRLFFKNLNGVCSVAAALPSTGTVPTFCQFHSASFISHHSPYIIVLITWVVEIDGHPRLNDSSWFCQHCWILHFLARGPQKQHKNTLIL